MILIEKKIAKFKTFHYRDFFSKNLYWICFGRVFDDLWVLRNHSGLVLFLEEDHYVAEDFLHMLMLYNEALPQACPKCSIITLGNYLKNYNFANDAKRVSRVAQTPSKRNCDYWFSPSTLPSRVWHSSVIVSSSFLLDLLFVLAIQVLLFFLVVRTRCLLADFSSNIY